MESVVLGGANAAAPEFPERPAVSALYEIVGRFLLFESHLRALPPGLERMLAGFYSSPVDARISADAIVSFRPDDFGPIEGDFERFEVPGDGKCYVVGDKYLFDFDSWRVVVHPYPSRQIDVLMTQKLDLTQAKHVQVFNYAISAALRRCSLYELHSAAVLDPRTGKGILFVGPSGSGKSTLTLQLAAAGWQYLTDDIVLLNEGEEAVEARPLRRAFAVTEASISASGHKGLKQASTALDWFDVTKRRFAPRDFFPGAFAASCVPSAIFFPMLTHEEKSVISKLSPSESMIRLVKMCPWACYDRGTGTNHLRILATLARQGVSYELQAGRDLMSDALLLSRLILAET